MKERTVTIEIDEQGNSSIDLLGFQGQGCADVVRAFRGADIVTKSQTRREFYVQAPAAQVQQKRS